MAHSSRPARKAAGKSARRTSGEWTDEERAAMKERAQERKAAAQVDGEQAVLAKIAEMPDPDRAMAQQIHAIIRANAPDLSPRLWYGMPAYARDGRVVCFFQGAYKFKMRYATLGFTDAAHLDDGNMWPVAFALKALTADEAERIGEWVRRAAGG